MTDKTRIVSARIPNEVADEMEKRLKAESYSLRELITDYANGRKTSVNTENSEKNVSLTAKYGINEDDLAEMDSMRLFMGGSVGVMIRGITEALCEGRILYENGRFVGMPEIDLDEFKEVCGSKDPQKVLNDITRKIRSGLL